MKAKSKAVLFGAALGTLILGPGAGTLLGAKWGADKHDEEARKVQDRLDDDEHGPYDHRQA